MQEPQFVFLIHAKDAFADELVTLLRSLGILTLHYDSGEKYLEDSKCADYLGCLIVNLGQPELNGNSVLESLAHSDRRPPIIILTDQVDVNTAVRAFRHDPSAFLLKQYVGHSEILDAIQTALSKAEELRAAIARSQKLNESFAALTPREQEVLRELVRGEEVVAIAESLGVDRRAVEGHRRRLMAKLKVTTFPMLIALELEYRSHTRQNVVDPSNVFPPTTESDPRSNC